MQFSIAKDVLLKYLRRLSGVVDKKNLNTPVLSNVLVDVNSERIVLSVTDTSIELTNIIKSNEFVCGGNDWKTTINFRKLYDICRVLPDGQDITIKNVDDKILVLSQNSKFSLTTLPADGFPSVNIKAGVLNFTIDKKQLIALIEKTAFAMAEQDVRYFLNGMLFEIRDSSLFTVAADGHRLAMNFIPIDISKNKSIRIIVPKKGVLELMRALSEDTSPMVNVTIGINHIRVDLQDFTFTSMLLEGKFPDYEKVIPKGLDKVIYAGKDSLKSAFVRASALFFEKQRGVKTFISQGKLKLLANNSEQDEAEEFIDVDYNGIDLNISFNARYLIDYLSSTNAEKIKISMANANSAALLEYDENGAYVLMPMRI